MHASKDPPCWSCHMTYQRQLRCFTAIPKSSAVASRDIKGHKGLDFQWKK